MSPPRSKAAAAGSCPCRSGGVCQSARPGFVRLMGRCFAVPSARDSSSHKLVDRLPTKSHYRDHRNTMSNISTNYSAHTGSTSASTFSASSQPAQSQPVDQSQHRATPESSHPQFDALPRRQSSQSQTFQARYGDLHTGPRQQLGGVQVAHGTYVPKRSMHIAGTHFNDVLPDQRHLVSEDLEMYRDSIRMGQRPQAVDLSLTDRGNLKVTDGHHRFAAALAEGQPVDVRITSGREPQPHNDWRNVSIIHDE